jgi:hypothetical protein
VIAARYLERNPDLPVFSAMQQIPITAPPPKSTPSRASAVRIAYRSRAIHLGVRHHLLSRVFVRRRTRPQSRSPGPAFGCGRNFIAKRAHRMSSSWLRPTPGSGQNFYVGPDGALYVMDFYLMIEHPSGCRPKRRTPKI